MTKIHMTGLADASSAYAEFSKKLLAELASAMGVTYEQMTANYDAAARSRCRSLSDLAFDPTSALTHLEKRGYLYRPTSGWCARPPLASLDLSSEDARAILYLNIVGNLTLPRGISYANLVDHAFELSANRYVLVDVGAMEKAPEPVATDAADDFNQPPEDLIGTLLKHTGNGKTYQITGSVWLGETDQWGYLHRAMGERGPMIARPLSHIKGTRSNGQRRYVEIDPVPAAKSVGRDDACETRFSERTPEDGAITLAKWPEGYVLWHHGEIVWRSWSKDDPVEAKPAFKASDLDVLKHALRLWKAAGEGLGIEIRQDYVDRLLNTALAHADLG